MARPLKKGLEYYPHDVDMSEDLKIRKLEAKFGLTGYAIYNKILEKIYKSGGKFDLKDEDDLLLFASAWKISDVLLKEIINYCIKVKLFIDENLTSEGINERIKVIDNLRQVKRTYYKKSDISPGVLEFQNYSIRKNNSSETPQSKVKESKEKKSSVCRENHTHDFEKFHTYFIQEKDYSNFKEYDLKYYFERVINFYPDKKFTDKELKAKIIFFISNDQKSDKHNPVKNPAAKKDSVTVAYELVHKNIDWIKNLPDKNPDEVVPQLVQKCRDPARKDTLFEAYLHRALRHYVPAIYY